MEQSYNWILSCINSSSNSFQFKCCTNLIELFLMKYKDSSDIKSKIDDLELALDNQIVRHSVDI